MSVAATHRAADVRRPRRVQRLGDRFHAGTPRLLAVMFWIILPVFCVAMIGVGTDRVIRHLSSFPAGTRGTYVVTSHNCHNQVCQTGGTFTSDDGLIVEPDLQGEYSWRIGEKHGVVYSGNAADVIPLPGQWDASPYIVGVAGAVSYLALWGWLLARARRVERRPGVNRVE